MKTALFDNKKLRFGILLLICILSGAEVDIFTPSMPDIQHFFAITPAEIALTISVNFIAYCVCTFFVGPLGDKLNRRMVMNAGLLIFLLGSILCVFSPSFTWLLIGRALQGIGMSAPAILNIAILVDDYPPEKQAKVLGLLNGSVTAAMAFAPVLGSWVNQQFSWRGNFQVLLWISVLSLIGSFLTVNSKPGNKSISLSPKAYWPLLCNRELMLLVGTMSFMSATYWSFVGLSSILYIEGFGVSVTQFGYYQGALCGIFAIGSFLLPKFLSWFTEAQCMRWSLQLCYASLGLVLLLAMWNVSSPMMITMVMVIYSIAVICPCNILYPRTLKVIENSEARAGAMVNGLRLLITGVSISIMSTLYDGTFRSIGLGIAINLSFALLCVRGLGLVSKSEEVSIKAESV